MNEFTSLLSGHGYDVHFVEGDEPMVVHQALAETLDTCYEKIRSYQTEARSHGFTKRPRWPAHRLAHSQRVDWPKEVDGLPVEGTFRAHQVPVADVKTKPEHLHILEEWMKSYHPEALFDEQGRILSGIGGARAKG